MSIAPAASPDEEASPGSAPAIAWMRDDTRAVALAAGLVAALLFLAFFNLTAYPTTWFDEGAHLLVPKTLVQFGVYGQHSSEGFRYFGATIGIGPTVLLPIAAVFRVFGVGLLPARLVMAVYLVIAIALFFWLARQLGGRRLACIATALVISSPATGLIETGRQVLGEVPGLAFLAAGLGLWFAHWEQARWPRLFLVGMLFCAAWITKLQYLIAVAPALGAAWLLLCVYRRTLAQRVVLVPALIAAACTGVWYAALMAYAGAATTAPHTEGLRQSVAGAAVLLSPAVMSANVRELLSMKAYLGALLPAVLYGAACLRSAQRTMQQWTVLWLIVVANLTWYVVASIGWLRYAFPGLAIAGLFVGRFLLDLYGVLGTASGRDAERARAASALRWAVVVWAAVMIAVPLARTIGHVAVAPPNAAKEIAAYLDAHVPREALVETWEQEVAFLTEHTYHFPPQELLPAAVAFAQGRGPGPAQHYDLARRTLPPYILLGPIGRSAAVYSNELLGGRYRLLVRVRPYDLWARREADA